ncbi:MAG: ImmA/IrrE family metallo-endopeptidase [Pseudomonadota bacterium]
MEQKSPEKWAYQLTHLLNAAYAVDERFPINVPTIAIDFSNHIDPEQPIKRVEGAELPGFDGALAPVGKKGWGILYNTTIESRGRINFTLAHELGHYLLHRLTYPKGIRCGEDDVVRWDSEYGQVEHQANVFAANLLMPLDDFRRQVGDDDKPDLSSLSACAQRYEVSLIAAIRRWIDYTARRAVLVVSREGYILWARSSRPAWRTGAFFRTASGPPVAIPQQSAAATREGEKTIELAPGTWFEHEPVEETIIASERYDFVISLLQLPSIPPLLPPRQDS